MLKLRKIFSLGLAAAALGLIALSCVEPVDYWTVYMMTGTINENDDTTLSERKVIGTSYIEGDYVTINAGKPYYGKKFYTWTSLPAVDFDNVEDSTTRFLMPGQDVVVTAWFIDAETTKLEPQVRYTWAAAMQTNIQSIAANDEDVADWVRNVFLDSAYNDLDATDYPEFSGSPDIPQNIYSRDLHAETGSPHKGVYLDISEGMYTAVCTVEDLVLVDDDGFPHVYDIVANYEISIGSDGKSFFEIAFDVESFLNDDDDIGWDKYKDNNKNTPERLKKKKAAKLLKKIVKDDVTYYVFRRASK